MKKTVKVVFKEDVGKHLKGDEAEVQLGYARNYLLPNKKAFKFNDPNAIKMIESLKEERLQKQKEIDKIKKIAEEYQLKEIIFNQKATSTGKLFGSIGVSEVSKELKLPKDKIIMQPIKEIGKYIVELDLGNNVKSKVNIKVEKLESLKK